LSGTHTLDQCVVACRVGAANTDTVMYDHVSVTAHVYLQATCSDYNLVMEDLQPFPCHNSHVVDTT